ncbi:uncharacterized protein LOC120159009 [Hibiscus syriacus]|uniref:uncharacterized protein LOC120159009 n=1 Tax=Hibiscus syriacus TaxID=106335 RepID=UPI001923FA27|nr:uncharacterized protein LOC120159009 [Hibiscus syriacus]
MIYTPTYTPTTRYSGVLLISLTDLNGAIVEVAGGLGNYDGGCRLLLYSRNDARHQLLDSIVKDRATGGKVEGHHLVDIVAMVSVFPNGVSLVGTRLLGQR